GGAERAWGTPGSCELQFLTGEPPCLAPLAQLQQRERRFGTPGHERRIAAASGLEAVSGLNQLLEAARHVALKDPQPRTTSPLGIDGLAFVIQLDLSAGVERGRGLVEPALLHQGVGQHPAEPAEALQPPLAD